MSGAAMSHARCELFRERQGAERIDEVRYMNSFSWYLRLGGKKRTSARAGDEGGRARPNNDNDPR
jgi:hypothetical protein